MGPWAHGVHGAHGPIGLWGSWAHGAPCDPWAHDIMGLCSIGALRPCAQGHGPMRRWGSYGPMGPWGTWAMNPVPLKCYIVIVMLSRWCVAAVLLHNALQCVVSYDCSVVVLYWYVGMLLFVLCCVFC